MRKLKMKNENAIIISAMKIEANQYRNNKNENPINGNAIYQWNKCEENESLK